MALSTEYITAIYNTAKSYLPKWVWDAIHKKAFPKSGGVARHRKEDEIGKQMAPISPSGLDSLGISMELKLRGEQYSKTEAEYIEPTKDANLACGACRFYLRCKGMERGGCDVVWGDIAWFGSCKFFISAVEEANFALESILEKQGETEIQTLIFPKDKWTLARARVWLRDHDFKQDKVDETPNSYRFRQQDPADFARIRPFCIMPQGARPNLNDCRILAFGGPTVEQAEGAEKRQHLTPDQKRRRQRRMRKDEDEVWTDEDVEMEVSYFLSMMNFEKQEDQPARALPVAINAQISNLTWDSGPEVAAMTAGQLRRSTLAFVGGDPEVKANYKLPYRDRRGRINAGAVRAIQAALGGGRGGVQLPVGIRPQVRRNAQRLMDTVRGNAEKMEKIGKDLGKEFPILKVDEEKRIVYGVVLDPYIIDTQGDWSPPAEIEKTAHGWMAISRTIGLQHKGPANAIPVESFLMPYPADEDYRKAMNNEPHRIIKFKFGAGFVHSGSWVLGTKINDDPTWELVKSGELGSYSIGGRGEREEIKTNEQPQVTETIEADWSKAA